MLTGGPLGIEASADPPCHYPGPTLLPGPVAHAVSLATRSTSLAIRLGFFVGYCSLDAARFTTLSSLGLARGLVETVLGRAARDTMALSCSELGVAEAESVFERSLQGLHFAVTQIVFWTAAGFRFTGTSISTASEASQLLLESLDKIFGSTDSSRAVASIITLVRRELNSPATGARGEMVGVSDLLAALSVLAYLQGASRRSAVEEARRQSYEEVIWDVVVLSDGERIDVGHGHGEMGKHQSANDSPRHQNELAVRYGANEDDEAIMERLRDYVAANLDPGTTVSISNSVSSVQTITVDVSGPQLLSLPTPPGAEIVETRGSANLATGSRPSWTFGVGGDNSYTVVYRIRRDKLRTTSLQGEEEEETGHAVAEMKNDIPAPSIEAETEEEKSLAATNDIDLRSNREAREARRPAASTSARSAISPPGSNRSTPEADAGSTISSRRRSQASALEPTANQKRQRAPPTRVPSRDSSLPLARKPPVPDASKRFLPRRKSDGLSGAKNTEKMAGGVKKVFRESSQSISSIWNKEPSSDIDARLSAKQRPQWKGVGRAVTLDTSTKSKSPPGRAAAQAQQPSHRSSSGRRVQTPGPYGRPSSRTSYVSVHERRRSSIVSSTESFPRSPTSGTPPSSPTIYRTDFSTQQPRSPSSGNACSPLSARHKAVGQHIQQHHQHQPHHLYNRSSIPYAPSLYSLATNDSQSSLLLASYYQKSAYNASGALNILRNEGFVDGTFPAGHLLPNIARYMRYSSACYGSHFLKLLGISTELPASQVWDGTHQDVRHFAHHTESHNGNILLASFVDPQGGSDSTGSTGTGVPLVHYISLDHEAKAVVLACRGTLGFEDILADLTCDYDDLMWRGRAYRVHKGVHASARRLLYGGDGRVLATLKKALLEFPEYGLVLCGHSLGGGVTSLLGVMLAEPNSEGPGFVISAEPQSKLVTQGPAAHQDDHHHEQQQQQQHKFSDIRLPRGRRIHVYAYGPPGIMSPSLRKITRGLITTVVHGNDIVPHLSLGVLHDFQSLALAFKKDENNTKAEIRRRMWRAFQGHLAEKWYHTTPAAPRQGDEEWVLPMLQALRGSMKGKRLVPPGEVFAIETTRVLRRDAFVVQEEAIGRPARRVVLKYITDVERRFREIRFSAGLLTDHSPAKYEDALNKLRLGVVE
ncbi:hypothetical protein E4U54_007477 [Claviceps lovelessii]|nr:hypothetical protein E4U54_007477 [Claviceps lovelessii]